jgi:plasmid stabilization system protein ParE
MAYSVARVRQANDDLDAIFDFLVQAHLHLGDDLETAFARAAARVQQIKLDLRSLAKAPHQGTLRPQLAPGLRSVTKDRAIFYFTVDDDARVVRVLAVFFGGQDHQREMLRRLMRKD